MSLYGSEKRRARRASANWRAKNPEKRKAYQRQYDARPDVRAKRNAFRKEYDQSDKRKAWKSARIELRRTQARDQAVRRRASVAGTLHNRIARGINAALRDGKNRQRTFELLGYTVEQLTSHIERQFTRGMNWQKFLNGQIHIDHIRPVTSFKIHDADDPELRACWALTNLRPLWAADNMRKGRTQELLL